jgi:hypothetical protein
MLVWVRIAQLESASDDDGTGSRVSRCSSETDARRRAAHDSVPLSIAHARGDQSRKKGGRGRCEELSAGRDDGKRRRRGEL